MHGAVVPCPNDIQQKLLVADPCDGVIVGQDGSMKGDGRKTP